jgi:hypothetical protein
VSECREWISERGDGRARRWCGMVVVRVGGQVENGRGGGGWWCGVGMHGVGRGVVSMAPFSLTCKQRNAACDFARECFARHLARADGDAGGNTQPGGIPKAERTRSKFAQSRAFVARVNTCGGDARGR